MVVANTDDRAKERSFLLNVARLRGPVCIAVNKSIIRECSNIDVRFRFGVS